MEVVPWAIPGKCPLCGELAQIEFDDAEGDTDPGNTVMMRELSCTNVGCEFFPPDSRGWTPRYTVTEPAGRSFPG